MFGMAVSAIALVTYVGVIAIRIATATTSDWRDVAAIFWDRDILAFFLVGMLLFGLGLVGEYVGRIYQQVRARPRYTVRAVLDATPAADTTPVVTAPAEVGRP
jgi:undecaprenyl-phosphate 4-deoxy-4-formamido-L-arabinose transferase